MHPHRLTSPTPTTTHPGFSTPTRGVTPREHVLALVELPDLELVTAIGAGDQDALSELFRRHRHALWAFAHRTVRSADAADEAVAQALVAVWRQASRFRGQARVSTWLHAITKNAALDVRRRETVRTGGQSPVPVDDPGGAHDQAAHDDHAELTVDRDLIRRMLAGLPPEQRRTVELVDLHGYSTADAARALGVAIGTVKSRRARAFTALARTWRVNDVH